MSGKEPENKPLPAKGGRTSSWRVSVVLLAMAILVRAQVFGSFHIEPAGEPVTTVQMRSSDPAMAEPLRSFGFSYGGAEGLNFADLSREEARRINADVPFSDAPMVSASAYRSPLEGTDRDRARSCLAVAAVYEAGANANDQKPVMQVVLNRVRHPAFPNSVCEVVFQGAELSSGCQFSFTCDGSMQRKPSDAVLSKAMGLAEWMLVEGVDDRVGHATHYHTDWVVPRWSAKLNKLTKINSHIFFNWTGYWGQQRAFREAPLANEDRVPQLASYSVAHGGDARRIDLEPELWADLNALEMDELSEMTQGVFPPTNPDAGLRREFVIPTKALGFAGGMTPGRWSLNAAGACGDLPACRVVGWAEPSRAPAQINEATIARSPPDLIFVQDLRNRVQAAYWDCSRWDKAATSKCLGSSSERLALVNGTRLN